MLSVYGVLRSRTHRLSHLWLHGKTKGHNRDAGVNELGGVIGTADLPSVPSIPASVARSTGNTSARIVCARCSSSARASRQFRRGRDKQQVMTARTSVRAKMAPMPLEAPAIRANGLGIVAIGRCNADGGLLHSTGSGVGECLRLGTTGRAATVEQSGRSTIIRALNPIQAYPWRIVGEPESVILG